MCVRVCVYVCEHVCVCARASREGSLEPALTSAACPSCPSWRLQMALPTSDGGFSLLLPLPSQHLSRMSALRA